MPVFPIKNYNLKQSIDVGTMPSEFKRELDKLIDTYSVCLFHFSSILILCQKVRKQLSGAQSLTPASKFKSHMVEMGGLQFIVYHAPANMLPTFARSWSYGADLKGLILLWTL